MRQEKKSAYLVIETTGVLKKMCKQSSNFDIIRSQGKSDIRTYVRTRAYMSVCAHVRASRTRNEKYFPKLKFIISGIFFFSLSLSLSSISFLPSTKQRSLLLLIFILLEASLVSRKFLHGFEWKEFPLMIYYV